MSDDVDVERLFLESVREARQTIENSTLEDTMHEYGAKVTDKAVSAETRRLHARNARAKLEPKTPPLSQFPKEALEEFYRNIGSIANQVSERAVRPDNEHLLRQLREREAELRHRVGADGLALYKTHNPNPDYAHSGPLPWSADLPRNSNFSLSSIEEHQHTREDTVVPSVLSLLGDAVGDGEALPDELVYSDTFRYLMMPSDQIDALQSLAAHDVAVEMDNKLLGELRSTKLDSCLERMKRHAQLALHAVVVRPCGTLDVVFSLEPTASLFAVCSFSVDTLRGARRNDVDRFCDKVCEEILKSREEMAKEAKKTRSVFVHERARSAEEMLRELRRLQRLRMQFHADYRDAERIGDPLCYCTALLAVFDPEFSATLVASPVSFQHMYFSCCQCRHDKSDLSQLLGVGGTAEEVASGGEDADDDVDDKATVALDLAGNARKRIRTEADARREASSALLAQTQVGSSVPTNTDVQ